MLKVIAWVLATTSVLLLFVLPACKGESVPAKVGPQSSLPEKFWLPAAPAGTKGVLEVREKAQNGDPVAVMGVIGGRKQPFTDGIAAFTIVDDEAKKCTEGECETPWDFCCTPPDHLAKATVIVEFHEDGRPIRTGARGFHGLEPMKKVFVTGAARRDDAGNVTIVANGVHVRP